MYLTRAAVLLGVFVAAAAGAAPLEIVRPSYGETVPLLTAEQKSYLDLPRAERVAKFVYKEYRKKMAGFGSSPSPVELAWRGGPGDAASVWRNDPLVDTGIGG